MHRRSIHMVATLLAATAACSSATDTTTTPRFAFTDTTPTVGIPPGGSTDISIAIRRTAFTSVVNLTTVGVPAGLQVGPSGTALAGDTVQLTISVDPATPAGTYLFHLHGTGAGVAGQDVVVSVTVAALAQYNLTFSPAILEIASGGSAQATVVIQRYAGFPGPITLVADSTLGITADLPATPVAGDSAIIVVHTPATLTPGTAYTLRVRGLVAGTLDGVGQLPILVVQ